MNPTQNPSALRSKKEITETLLLLMKQYTYHEITVKHILLESKVSRKTFYRNFTSKDDVLISYIDMIIQEYVMRIIEKQDYDILFVFGIIIDFCEEHKEILILLKDNQLFYLLLERWNIQLPQMHKKMIKEVRDDMKQQEQAYLIAFNIGAIWNVVAMWLENDMKNPPQVLKKILINYLGNIKTITLNNI